MLSCEELVRQTSNILDHEKLTLGQKISVQFHLFICRYCRQYLKQAQITVSVAHRLEHESVPEPLIENCVSKMKTFSQK